MSHDSRPHVVHVVYRFDIGGLENGLVTLLNRLPEADWRHTVLSLTTINEAFRQRVRRADVGFIALGKAPGHLFPDYGRLRRIFRDLRPDIVHTRNLAALEAVVPAWLAGVRARLHGEHGRDARDPDGQDRRLQRVRRLYRPFVTSYVALSRDLESYLVDAVGVSPRHVVRICNGVDTDTFRPARPSDERPAGWPFDPARHWVVGSVGRLDPVKGTVHLVRAVGQALQARPEAAERLRLAIVGDGTERENVERAVREEGLGERVWLAGARSDVPAVMRAFNCFALPSLGEGISNTVLEAMASGLPVVATRVGGNEELVVAGATGELVQAGDPAVLRDAVLGLFDDPQKAARYGAAGRQRAEREFGIPVMVDAYAGLYRSLLGRGALGQPQSAPTWQGVRH